MDCGHQTKSGNHHYSALDLAALPLFFPRRKSLVRLDTEISKTHSFNKPAERWEGRAAVTLEINLNIKALSTESFPIAAFFFSNKDVVRNDNFFVSPDDALLAFGYKP